MFRTKELLVTCCQAWEKNCVRAPLTEVLLVLSGGLGLLVVALAFSSCSLAAVEPLPSALILAILLPSLVVVSGTESLTSELAARVSDSKGRLSLLRHTNKVLVHLALSHSPLNSTSN